jgi:sugar phosphate isomerase/epimerase
MNFEIGAQTYTIRDYCKTLEDFGASMKKLAQTGYKTVQLSATGDFTARQVVSILDKYNLKAVLTHTNPQKILEQTDEVIRYHKAIGASYVGLGMMPQEYQADGARGAARFIGDFSGAIKKIADAGLKFMYHNHSFEFQKFGGTSIFDMLTEGLDKTGAGFTLDVYWVAHAGADPAFWLRKLKGRVDTVHYKDMIIESWTQKMAEVLEGNLNWREIFRASDEGGVKYAFVEQDDCYGKNPFECLKVSFNNLQNQ